MDKILAPITNFLSSIFMAFYNFVASVTGNATSAQKGLSLVLAVFLITLLVRLIILPLTIKQMKSTSKMQEVQPLVKKAQEKYKGNPEKANAEVMKLYKENNVSMTGGCLPLIIQMPILFALYDVFNQVGQNALLMHDPVPSFLWISNLGGHDKFYILPILSGLSTYLSSYLMQKGTGSGENSPIPMGTMNIVMGVMLGFMSLRFPALLVFYWIIGNVIQMIQTYFLIILPKKKKMKKMELETGIIDVTPTTIKKKKK